MKVDEENREIHYKPGHCSVDDYLKRLQTLKVKPSPSLIVETFRFLSHFALFFSEKMGLYHGDIKPQNIVLVHDREGKCTLKMIDFGEIT